MLQLVETAVILAAGCGTRLRESGRQIPKGFLTLGTRPIVEESIGRLLETGIKRVVIVTGHRAEYYEALAKRYSGTVELTFNARYTHSGSMYSLYLARGLVTEDFLLLESDLIYEQRAVQSILEFPMENGILLSGPTKSGDEVFVAAKDERLVGMAKEPGALTAPMLGELVGISRVSRKLFRVMVAWMDRMVRQTLMLDYETDGFVAATAETPVYCHLVPDLIWSEIDDAAHLERARRTVYPLIREADARTGW